MAENEVVSIDPLAGVIGQVDVKLEEEGDWFFHAPEIVEGDDDDIEKPIRQLKPNEIEGFRHLLLDANGNGLRSVKVRGRFTSDYEKAEDKLSEKVIGLKRSKRMAFNRKAVKKLTADHCIVEWDFTNVDGVQIPCTPAIRNRIMNEKKFRHHRHFINLAVGKLQKELDDIIEEDEQD